jgi:hypothetical protein
MPRIPWAVRLSRKARQWTSAYHRATDTPSTRRLPALVWADADSREYGEIAHNPAMAHLLVARIEDEIFDLAKGAVPRGRQPLIQQIGGAADLRGRQCLDAELAHHGLNIMGRNALDVHLGDMDAPSASSSPLDRSVITSERGRYRAACRTATGCSQNADTMRVDLEKR